MSSFSVEHTFKFNIVNVSRMIDVLGRTLWHALALTDALPLAPQFCSTSREDKRTGFTVPPQTTLDLWASAGGGKASLCIERSEL